jgi:hypothetical protein
VYRPGRPRLHGAVDVRPKVRYNYRRAERSRSIKAEGNMRSFVIRAVLAVAVIAVIILILTHIKNGGHVS